MTFQDIREYLSVLESAGQLARIKAPVDPRFELGAICHTALQKNNRALLFENVTGATCSVAANLLASPDRVALALGTTPDKLTERWAAGLDAPRLTPKMVNRGHCKEVIIPENEANLLKSIPQIVWNEKDGGAYIPAGLCITKSADGVRNVGIYRIMILDERRLVMMILPGRDILRHLEDAVRAGRALETAIVVGVEPVTFMAGASKCKYGEDEFSLAGSVRGEPLELVKCETVDIEVPATAEFVIEGEIATNELADEGPFGEVRGYYGSGRRERIVRIKAITHRNQPIYQGLHCTIPPNEGTGMTMFQTTARVTRILKDRFPQIADVHPVEATVGVVMFISLKENSDGLARDLGEYLAETEQNLKVLVILDEDVDLRNTEQVLWAISTRIQPITHTRVLPKKRGSKIDPAYDENALSLLIIDATRPVGREFPEVCRPSAALQSRLISRWHEYFPLSI